MVRPRPAVALLLLTAVMAACARGDSDGADPSPVTTSAPATPQVGECRGPISQEIFAADTDTRPTVPCDQAHGSETVLVGQLPAAVAALPQEQAAALSNHSPEMFPTLDQCTEEFDRYVGVSRIGPDAVRRGNLSMAFFVPPAEDWARGARWVRCDAVTEPFAGQAVRSTTESLRGILARDPLPAAWRSCYGEVTVAAPPTVRYEGFTSCDQPHEGEVLLRFQVSDPKVDALAGDPRALEEFARTGFVQVCTDRVAAHMGLSTAAFTRRGDIRVVSTALQVPRWATDPKSRQVQCLGFTQQPTVGTLEGLGTKPLPSSTSAPSAITTAPPPAAGQSRPPTTRAGAPPSASREEQERRAACQRAVELGQASSC